MAYNAELNEADDGNETHTHTQNRETKTLRIGNKPADKTQFGKSMLARTRTRLNAWNLQMKKK